VRHYQSYDRVLTRRRSSRWGAVGGSVLAALGWACADNGQSEPTGSRPGGAATVSFEPKRTFLRPSFLEPENAAASPARHDSPGTSTAPGSEARASFYAGKALAGQPWVRAPSSTDARDGLGPLYNARTCFACHPEGGRGETGGDGPAPVATVVRLTMAPAGGPDPIYGSQIQTRSVGLASQLRELAFLGKDETLPFEATPVIQWKTHVFDYPDGQSVELRKPRLKLSELSGGPVQAELGLRHAPPLHGMGLLNGVSDEALRQRADPADRDGDGVSGRVRKLEGPDSGQIRIGRFGWKADRASLREQVASALRDDMGITSSMFPDQPCTDAQQACRASPSGADDKGVEISNALLELLVGFTRDLGVPERRKSDHPMVVEGGRHFRKVGCATCHVPRQRTLPDPDRPNLSEQVIWPYTDLLLHDMGTGLASPTGSPMAREWRTPPLWGVGLARAVRRNAGFLHDGRARTVEEAILWHGGEAEGSRQRFVELPAADRAELMAFVRSL
jgi:CxxC motif-containing protein (DUF1111 family)